MKKISSYHKWLIDHFGGTSLKEAISIAVDNLLKKTSQHELPVKLSEIAKAIGIDPYPIYKNQTPDAQLININNEFRIALKMKTEKPPSVYWHGFPRLRFSYAHELIHCLNYDFSNKPPTRIAPKANNKEEEVICNYGAGLLVLPSYLVKKYIETLEEKDIIYVATHLSKKSQTSLHASFLHLINQDYLNSRNKLFILSLNSEGYRKRGQKKPRLILSALYLDDGEIKQLLPTYKGIEAVSKSWSLIKFHNKLFDESSISEIKVRNEIIQVLNNKYLINGKHQRIEGSGYVWSDLSIIKISD